MTIEGLVADVLTDRELVINRGTKQGVEIGMRFRILANRGTDIKDPENGQVLGTVEVLKTVVKIVEVKENLSVGRTFRTLKESGGALATQSAIANLFKLPATHVETLEKGGRFSKTELSPDDSYVKIGDRAIQFARNEEDSINLSQDITVNNPISPRILSQDPESTVELTSGRFISNLPGEKNSLIEVRSSVPQRKRAARTHIYRSDSSATPITSKEKNSRDITKKVSAGDLAQRPSTVRKHPKK